MAKKTLLLSISSLLLGLIPLTSGAQGFTNIDNLVTVAVQIIFLVIGIVFTIAVVVFGWGIVKYLTAAGDATKLKDARGFLWWGVIGIFVLAAIAGLIIFLGQALGIETGGGGVIQSPNVSY